MDFQQIVAMRKMLEIQTEVTKIGKAFEWYGDVSWVSSILKVEQRQ